MMALAFLRVFYQHQIFNMNKWLVLGVSQVNGGRELLSPYVAFLDLTKSRKSRNEPNLSRSLKNFSYLLL